MLLVDDDPTVLRVVGAALEEEGYAVVPAADGEAALRRVDASPVAAVVLDLHMPGLAGKEVLLRLREAHPGTPVVMLTSEDRVEEVVECMRLGALDYVKKDADTARLRASVRNAVARGTLEARVASLTRELRRGEGFDALLGRSAAMERALALLRRAARGDVTLLLLGESGTGKEVAARAVHAEGPRRSGPFVAVNCGAIPEGLIESELFGHERGAFTGATAARRGAFEEADGGTLLLDEVGEIRVDLQVRLLRVLQERIVRPVGGSGGRPVDVRVMAASNRDLAAAMTAGEFREDLFYRLAVFPVHLPPLRERDGDVLLLAEAFLRRAAERHRRPAREFAPAAREALRAHSWPGNVRELMNVVERAVLLEDSSAVTPASLPAALAGPVPGAAPLAAAGGGGIPTLEEAEKRLVLAALEAAGGSVQRAAETLGISRATVYRKLDRYGRVAGGPGGAPAGEA